MNLSSKSRQGKRIAKGSPVRSCTELGFCNPKQREDVDQKQTLDLFLERGAISQEQYDISLGELTKKLGMTDTKDE